MLLTKRAKTKEKTLSIYSQILILITLYYLGALKSGDGAVLLGGNVQERILGRGRRIHQPKNASGR
jgi:hypothetical protein